MSAEQMMKQKETARLLNKLDSIVSKIHLDKKEKLKNRIKKTKSTIVRAMELRNEY